jgi:hypothetical protein
MAASSMVAHWATMRSRRRESSARVSARPSPRTRVRVVRLRRRVTGVPTTRVMLSASGRPAQVVTRISPWIGFYLSRRPFVLVGEPLLILMGRRP